MKSCVRVRQGGLSSLQPTKSTKNLKNTNLPNLNYFMSLSDFTTIPGIDSDSKQPSNPFKYLLNVDNLNKKNLHKPTQLNDNLNFSDLTISPNFNNFSDSFLNSESLLKEKNLKSSDSQFLASERTSRLLTNLNTSLYR